MAERARAVMGADSAITLDGQSRVAMDITTYALPRRASRPYRLTSAPGVPPYPGGARNLPLDRPELVESKCGAVTLG